MFLHINEKLTMDKFCRNISFLTLHYCPFRGVGQGMKQTKLYLWYPLYTGNNKITEHRAIFQRESKNS